MAKKVLVVDDEQDIRVFMTTLLETNGYKVIAAKDGLEGLEMARAKHPGLIIMDIMMPKESGIFMYREIKKDPAFRASRSSWFRRFQKRLSSIRRKSWTNTKGEKSLNLRPTSKSPPRPMSF